MLFEFCDTSTQHRARSCCLTFFRSFRFEFRVEPRNRNRSHDNFLILHIQQSPDTCHRLALLQIHFLEATLRRQLLVDVVEHFRELHSLLGGSGSAARRAAVREDHLQRVESVENVLELTRFELDRFTLVWHLETLVQTVVRYQVLMYVSDTHIRTHVVIIMHL